MIAFIVSSNGADLLYIQSYDSELRRHMEPDLREGELRIARSIGQAPIPVQIEYKRRIDQARAVVQTMVDVLTEVEVNKNRVREIRGGTKRKVEIIAVFGGVVIWWWLSPSGGKTFEWNVGAFVALYALVSFIVDWLEVVDRERKAYLLQQLSEYEASYRWASCGAGNYGYRRLVSLDLKSSALRESGNLDASNEGDELAMQKRELWHSIKEDILARISA